MGEKQSLFEELFLPHLAAAYNLAYWIVGRHADAEDVVQEAYLKALKGFKGFRGTNARSWLLSIVRNAAYSWAKRNSKDSNVIPFDEELHTPPWNECLLPSHHQDRIDQIHAALTLLSAEFREILLLREVEGWSYKELASILKVPAGTVMSRLSRARQRLRQELVKVHDEELQNGL